ncbi:uncharacterized protein ARMOST_03348 [Armillaria ostoyae]|uniref:Uncharacterized protein n=1 Tax=Armillaria ostoyae TaxID=47428 RepID=A0A284QUA3_ARMOS|nr:uncharacterized protein ARMOST_03348 [Armillaria ostoyae]
MAVKEDVKKFNSLPRPPRMPSGNFLNEWHFDLRFVHCLQPPSHILFLVQPGSTFAHFEFLPNDRAKGMTFFPETAKEAAPETAKALIHAFLSGFSDSPGRAMSPMAPWKLTTDDPDLQAAIEQEFRNLGIRNELVSIGATSPSREKVIMQSFLVTFDRIKHTFCDPESRSSTIIPPFSIGYKALNPPPLIPASVLRLVDQDNTMLEQGKIMAYAQLSIGCRPHDASKSLDSSAVHEEIMTKVASVEDLFKSQPMNAVKTKANAGDADAALDYGLRLMHGCGCSPNRSLARQYLVMAAYSPKGTSTTKATAHGVLVDWYSAPSPMPQRYLRAATWHANEVVKLFPKRPSPMTLKFAFYVMEPQLNNIPDLAYQRQELLDAMKRRTVEVEKNQAKMDHKRLESPNRYKCAAVGCGIQSDSGRMLRECVVSTTLCQNWPCVHLMLLFVVAEKEDWGNHKPFCKPGAPCSVIDTSDVQVSAGGSTKNGAIQLPLKMPDGSVIILSTSTLTLEHLKEVGKDIEDQAVAAQAQRSTPLLRPNTSGIVRRVEVNIGPTGKVEMKGI